MNTHPVSAITVPGRRDHNEDAFLNEPDWGLYIVCDGMGGYHGGEIAAQTAVEVIRRFFKVNKREDNVAWPYALDPGLSLIENMVSMAVRLAHHTIVAKRQGHLAQMGTTLALLVIEDGEAIIAHIGDSRVYRLREGRLEALTRDHSFYNALLESGTSDLGDARTFAYKNIITRALGIPTSTDVPELRREKVLAGDVFLLTSDGVHDVLLEDDIARILRETPVKEAGARLVEESYRQGSTDNITALVMQWEGAS